MLYMVIERYHAGAAAEVYHRLRYRGRMMPDGLKYLGSWIEPDFSRCFQMMEWDDPAVFEEWKSNWEDLVDFEAVPVITSSEAQELMKSATASG